MNFPTNIKRIRIDVGTGSTAPTAALWLKNNKNTAVLCFEADPRSYNILVSISTSPHFLILKSPHHHIISSPHQKTTTSSPHSQESQPDKKNVRSGKSTVEYLIASGLRGGNAKLLACNPNMRHLKLIPVCCVISDIDNFLIVQH